MANLHVYLNFNGETEAAFNFYKSVFGGEFAAFQRFSDIPDLPDLDKMTDAEKQGIMHVALLIGSSMLMGTDTVASLGHPKVGGNNISITITPESKEEADRLFNGLSAGGVVTMPLQDMFWGDYYGMFTDKFGIQWMVNYTYPKG